MDIETATLFQSRWRRKDVLPMLLLALLGALLTLLAGQALKVRSDRLWLAGFTERLLEHADSVAATPT